MIWRRLGAGTSLLMAPERGEDTKPPPLRVATLTVRPDLFSVEAKVAHSEGRFWRRHFTDRFLAGGFDVIVWAFDAAAARKP